MNDKLVDVLIGIIEGVFTSDGLFGIITLMSLTVVILALIVMMRYAPIVKNLLNRK